MDDIEKKYEPIDPDLDQLEDMPISRKYSRKQSKMQSAARQMEQSDEEEKKQVQPTNRAGNIDPYGFDERRNT